MPNVIAGYGFSQQSNRTEGMTAKIKIDRETLSAGTLVML